MSDCAPFHTETAAPFGEKTSAEDNYSKLHFIYWNAAPAFLRQVFRDLWKRLLGSCWQDNRTFGKKLIETPAGSDILGLCKQFQKNCILSGNSSKWDLQLLLVIIQNLCPLLNNRGFTELSKITMKNLEFLRNTRNQLAHAGDNTVDDVTYKALWGESLSVLTSMGMNLDQLEKPKKPDFEKKTSGAMTQSDECATKSKLIGDEYFKANHYLDAAAEYSQGITQENVSHQLLGILYCNRSAAYLEMSNFQGAKDDAKSSITLCPQWFEGYARLGKAYEGLKRFDKAALNLSIAVRLGDSSKSTLESLDWCKMMETKRSCREHTESNNLRDVCVAWNQDYKTKFPKGTLEDFLYKGLSYYWGSDSFPVDYERAVQYFSKAAYLNSAWGQYLLGKMTMEGKGVEKDVRKGFELYMKAAAQDPVKRYENGLKRINEGVKYACHAVGLGYDTGFIVEFHRRKALQWYHKALLCGNYAAANNIAHILRFDYTTTVEYLKLSAHLGSTRAVEALAVTFLEKKLYTNAQQFFHFAIYNESIDLKEREHDFVRDCSLEKDFDPKKFKEMLEEDVRRSGVVGNILKGIEDLQDECKFVERINEGCRVNETKIMSTRRCEAILRHRKAFRENHEFLKKCGLRNLNLEPTTVVVGAENVEFEGLESIHFKEMEDQESKKLYSGRFLDLTVIEDAIIGTASIQLLVEDDNGDLMQLSIYNYPQKKNGGKDPHIEIGYGCHFAVIYPYLHRTTDGFMEIRVDDPELILKRKNLRNPCRCRYCGKTAETKIPCKKCRRVMYCSHDCLRKDSEDFNHSLICLKVVN